MPKDPWKYKPRKRRSRGKLQEHHFEPPLFTAPAEPSITIIDTLDKMSPIKTERERDLVYPDTRFPQSTTLFPAAGIENFSQLPGNFSESFKRVTDDDLFNIPKKMKFTDSTIVKKTLSEDCMIIENSPDEVAVSTKTPEESFCDDCMIIDESPKKVEVEVVDLTDESGPSVQMACTPVKISFPKPRKPNLTLKANDDAHVKVESNEKASGAFANTNTKSALQQKTKENKTSRPADTTTHNILLTSELDIVENGEVNHQVRVTNTVSVSVLNNARDTIVSDSHFVNDIPIILDQRKNWDVSDNSESVSKFTSDVNHSGIKTKRKYDVGDNYLSAPTPSLIYRTKVPSIVPLVVDNPSQSVIKTNNKERVKDWLAVCSGNGGKAQENSVSDKENKATDSNHSAFLTVAHVKEELKDADCQEISFNSDETQLNEDLSQKKTSTGLVSSETLTSNERNQGSIFLTNHNGVFPVVLQVNEQEEFFRKFLKYLNVNKKVELHEISDAILYLNNMIMGKEIAVGGNKLSEPSETSKNLPMEKGTSSNLQIKKEISNILPREKSNSNILELLSSDVLRQILITTNTAKPT